MHDGAVELPQEDHARLASRGIFTRGEPIARLKRQVDGARIVFTDGQALERGVIFIGPPTRQRSDLVA